MEEREFDARIARWGCGVGAVAMPLGLLIASLGEALTGSMWNSATFAISGLLATIGAIAWFIAIVFAIVWFGRWLLADGEDESDTG